MKPQHQQTQHSRVRGLLKLKRQGIGDGKTVANPGITGQRPRRPTAGRKRAFPRS